MRNRGFGQDYAQSKLQDTMGESESPNPRAPNCRTCAPPSLGTAALVCLLLTAATPITPPANCRCLLSTGTLFSCSSAAASRSVQIKALTPATRSATHASRAMALGKVAAGLILNGGLDSFL